MPQHFCRTAKIEGSRAEVIRKAAIRKFRITLHGSLLKINPTDFELKTSVNYFSFFKTCKFLLILSNCTTLLPRFNLPFVLAALTLYHPFTVEVI